MPHRTLAALAALAVLLLGWLVWSTHDLREAVMAQEKELSGQSVEQEVTRPDGQSALLKTEKYLGEQDAVWAQRHFDAIRMFKEPR